MDNLDKNSNDIEIKEELQEAEIEIIVDISNDYYEAFITILREDDSVNISREDILEALNKRNIVYGIKSEVIDSIIEDNKTIKKVLIAQGQRHKNGESGKIEYNFDINSINKPKLLESGTVDHKDLNYFLKAMEGETLARKILPTDPQDGTTVTGRTIKGKPGKMFEFKKGKNVTTSNDGLLLLAQAGGMIKFEDGRTGIIKVLEIDEDVGISTGNISFDGKIIVRGNIEAGYKINGGDDVEVFGIVHCAEIKAVNITIHKGVHNNARIIADGNIITNFLESCYAESKGDIICDAIIHSEIKCLGSVICKEKKGLILGGMINARKEVIAKTIGSQTGSTTRLFVGIDDNLLLELKETKKVIDDTKKDLEKILQAIKLLQVKMSNDPKKTIFLNKYIKTRDIYISRIKNSEEKLKEIYILVESLKNSKVSGSSIYPGTNIRINNSHYIVKSLLSNARLIKEDGDVVLSALI